MNTRDLQAALRRIGWPLAVDGDYGPATRAAVLHFQAGWNFWPRPIAVDGVAGPQTARSIDECLRWGGKCSPHFTYREFASRGNGWIRTERQLLIGLERYRAMIGRPVRIVSGHRDPAHNRRVGGARLSRHVEGDAADLDPVATLAQVRALGAFSGIGYQGSTGRVRHVDTRPGDPRRPTIWRY